MKNSSTISNISVHHHPTSTELSSLYICPRARRARRSTAARPQLGLLARVPTGGVDQVARAKDDGKGRSMHGGGGGGDGYSSEITFTVVMSCLMAASGGLIFGYDISITGQCMLKSPSFILPS